MAKLMVVKRTGEVVEFDEARISNAISKAIKAINAKVDDAAFDDLVKGVISEVNLRFSEITPNVENIQDIVEKHLMQKGLMEVARAYIIYREERRKVREQKKTEGFEKARLGKLTVVKRDGKKILFDSSKTLAILQRLSAGLDGINLDLVVNELMKNIYDGISTEEIERALILSAVAFVEKDPAYDYLSARLYLQKLFKEVLGTSVGNETYESQYRESFVEAIRAGVKEKVFDEKMLKFNLEMLSDALKPERDNLFKFIGVDTLYDRYFVRLGKRRIEMPQSFWMRVAMGLALKEEEKEARAIEFYNLLSSLRFVSSTPTLFGSGSVKSQLSSCYLTTISDDLHHIFKCLGDNAQMSKWAGGVANDWSYLRGTGATLKSARMESQGVVPFLRIANDVTVAISRSGRRRGATVAYLEAWHYDIEDFIDLRKNTGDERRRTPDLNTANWIPDLFMKRVAANQNWTLFSPDEVADLHDLYGRAFEKRYEEYESLAASGKIKNFKVIEAQKLWRKMLSMLFETGHPWITFKDPSNIRSPQDHVGIVHSSNLCTEITLNTSPEETAVCNLGSVNLGAHIVKGKLDEAMLAETVKTAMRMLDNVIDLNFYPTKEGETSNMRHRPVGLGLMGFADALYQLGLAFESQKTLEFTDYSMEFIAWHAIMASTELAKERGAYNSFKGSKWDRGILPLDSIKLLEEERGIPIGVSRTSKLDWVPVRESIKQYGMRNSNCMALAPTATIANIAGCVPTGEPIYKNLYVKANISGEFTVVNHFLVNDLKNLGLWSEEMLDQLKYYDGSVQLIAGLPEELKQKYKEAFEVDPEWLIKLTALRGKWIDQSQSHNVFMKGTSGKRLGEIYFSAWNQGLKTTYYLRTLAASQIEKSTLDAAKYGYTQKREYKAIEESAPKEVAVAATVNEIINSSGQEFELESKSASVAPKVCSILDPDCESCQ